MPAHSDGVYICAIPLCPRTLEILTYKLAEANLGKTATRLPSGPIRNGSEFCNDQNSTVVPESVKECKSPVGPRRCVLFLFSCSFKGSHFLSYSGSQKTPAILLSSFPSEMGLRYVSWVPNLVARTWTSVLLIMQHVL